jgi:hypothetical protein
LIEETNFRIQKLKEEMRSIADSQKEGYETMINLTSLVKEYRTILENKPNKEDLNSLSKLIKKNL